MFKVMCYYTPGFYQKVAEEYLIPSCKKWNIPHEAVGLKSCNSWGANTNLKASFVRYSRCLNENQDYDLVFIDCDATFESYPSLFNEIPEKYGFGCHFLDRNVWYNRGTPGADMELLSGVLFVRRKPEVMKALDCWVAMVSQQPGLWEQKHLAEAVETMDLDIYKLPLSYCYIATLPSGKPPNVKVENPVIVQYQKSREVRRNRIRV